MARTIDVRLIVSDDVTEADVGETLTHMEGLERAYVLHDGVPSGMPLVISETRQ